MQKDLAPEDVLKSLSKGSLAPFYLFYGPGEFSLERTLMQIRESYIPVQARDFNLDLFYGGETTPGTVLNRALTLPFMAKNRLLIVRRIDEYTPVQLEKFLPYLEKPAESSTIIFTAAATDFKRTFYKTIRGAQKSVLFEELKERQVVPWIKQTAQELGLRLDQQACVYLQQVAGNSQRDLYAEMEKLSLRFGEITIGIEEVKELVCHSRIYTIFELIDLVSNKKTPKALTVLNRFLEEEDKYAGPLRLIGMLNRQVRLLLQAKLMVATGGTADQVAHRLGLHPFIVSNLIGQIKHWKQKELVHALKLLYQADAWLKSSSRSHPVLENLVITLCEDAGLDG